MCIQDFILQGSISWSLPQNLPSRGLTVSSVTWEQLSAYKFPLSSVWLPTQFHFLLPNKTPISSSSPHLPYAPSHSWTKDWHWSLCQWSLKKKHQRLIQSVPDSFSGLRQVDPIRLRKETFSPCVRRSNLFVSTTPLDGGNHFVTTMEASLLTKVKYRGELSDRKCRGLIAQWLVSTLSLNFRIFSSQLGWGCFNTCRQNHANDRWKRGKYTGATPWSQSSLMAEMASLGT